MVLEGFSVFCLNINDVMNRNDSVCTLGVMVIDSIRDLHNINSLTNIDKHMRSIQTPAATLSWKHFEIMTEL